MKTLNLSKTTLALGLLASLAVVNTSQAGGIIGHNGLKLNGLDPNGMDLNGVWVNGASSKGLADDGINGFVVRDIALPDGRKSGDRKAVYRRPGRPR